MIINVLQLPGAGGTAQPGAQAQDGDFAAVFEKQIKPLSHKVGEMPAAVPGDTPVNALPGVPDVMGNPAEALPEHAWPEENDLLADGQPLPQPLPQPMPADPRGMVLQGLVVQMNTATAMAAGQGDMPAGEVEDNSTLSAISQAMLTTRQGTREGAALPPGTAAGDKQNSPVASAEAKMQKGLQPVVLPGPKQTEEPGQLTSVFKPAGGETINASPASFSSGAAIHTAPAALPVSHSSPAAMTATTAPILTQELGTPGWQQALSQQVAMFTRNGIHNAEIRLNPAELGAIKINLRMDSERANLHFVSENHQVRAVLEAAMPQLRTSLAESGIQLNSSSVGSDSAPAWGEPSYSDGSHGQAEQNKNAPDSLYPEGDEIDILTPAVQVKSGINTFV